MDRFSVSLLSEPQATLPVSTRTSSLCSTSSSMTRLWCDKWASAPFNRDDADLVCISSDNVGFLLHSQVLAVARLDFNQSDNSQHHTIISPDGREISSITVPDDSISFDILLRYIYPFARRYDSRLCVIEMCKAYRTAQRYGVSFVKEETYRQLQAEIPNLSPLHRFCCYCEMGDNSQAIESAKYLRKIRSISYPLIMDFHSYDGMESLTAGQYHRLICYLEFPPAPHVDRTPFCSPTKPSPWFPRLLLEDYITEAQVPPRSFVDPDFELISHIGVRHPVPRTVLINASPYFSHLKVCMRTRNMRVDIGQKATDALIALCLNELPDITDLNAFHALMGISIKYRVMEAARKLKGGYLTLVMSQPTCYFQSFCRALLYGWEEEARIIALWSLQQKQQVLALRRKQQEFYFTDFEGYPEMDSIPARPVAILLRCRRLVCREIEVSFSTISKYISEIQISTPLNGCQFP